MREMVLKLWRNRWLRAALLLALLAVWVLVPHRWEGPVVWSITDDHGVHTGDLWGLVVAAVLLVIPARSRPPAND